MQEFLPNTYPSGAANPCPTCPSGFVYLTSNGRSTRHAGQFQLRRRLRNGLTATVQYTLAKAIDDARRRSARRRACLAGAAIAQDWLRSRRRVGAVELRSASSRDRAVPVHDRRRRRPAARCSTGLKGTLFKGWTLTSQLNAGSGLPLTPTCI